MIRFLSATAPRVLRNLAILVAPGVLLLPVFVGPLVAGNTTTPAGGAAGVFLPGEELVYNVRYGFIDLGQVRIVTGDRVKVDGHTAFNGEASIQSYKGVPFVDLHALYYSVMDSTGFSHRFVGKTREDGIWSYSRYLFQYDQNRVVMELGTDGEAVEERDTLSLETRYNDGLSLFFHARDLLFSGKQVNIPTFVREKKGNTFIDFNGNRRSVETDFIDYPVDAVGFEGNAGFVGVFGLTGDFEGWFSNDGARVPIMARMKVIIGSVTIELVKWTRPGWEPPRGTED
jgi:hypothetical protein